MPTSLPWLKRPTDFNAQLAAVRRLEAPAAERELRRLAGCGLDFVQTTRVDKEATKLGQVSVARAKLVKLAVIGSSTLAHLLPSIRVGALRRGFNIQIHEGDYGSYYQQLVDPGGGIREFQPDFVLLALDAAHLTSGGKSLRQSLSDLQACWDAIRALGAVPLQQTLMPRMPNLLGNNEHRLETSPAALLTALNAELRRLTAAAGVELVALDTMIAQQGLGAWHDPALWCHAKQEVHPQMAPEYGDHVARLIAALRGLSSKCLVLDLDNTLWGGVIGDDGLNGIVLGQGSATGEAHLALQAYAKGLSERGVILAVCSKNDEATAREPFERHDDMLLRLPDIACFVANWQDKAANLRRIAEDLSIGLDALVFADDNPFERDLVRRELPQVQVPELPEDPALYVACLVAGGYFESIGVTADDRERGRQYQQKAQVERLRATATDLDSYLNDLQMILSWEPFTAQGLPRITQLINKTNQFNLTTRRYVEADIRSLMTDARAITLQLRLQDRFGDNGMIAVVIGRLDADDALELDSWLMSCRVLGRGVEQATLGIVMDEARRLGAKRLRGRYLPTEKNGMVKDHYEKLGFERVGSDAEPWPWSLSLDREMSLLNAITIKRANQHGYTTDLRDTG